MSSWPARNFVLGAATILSPLLARTRRLARAEEGDHREDAAVVVTGLREEELYEDAVHVLLDRALGDPQPPRDAAVGPAFSHQRENLALARRELLERIVGRAGGDKLDDQRRVDDRTAAAKAVDALKELVDVRNPALQQVAASLPARQERRRVLDLDVGREDKDRRLRDLVANGLCRPETFRRVIRRHPDVDDGKVGPMLAYEIQELRRIAGLTNDAVARDREQAGDPLAEQEVVVGDDDAAPRRGSRVALHLRAGRRTFHSAGHDAISSARPAGRARGGRRLRPSHRSCASSGSGRSRS